MRGRYNELGSEATNLGPEGGFMDPKDLFRHLFGGEAFVEIIGEISFVQMFAQEQQGQAGDVAAIGHHSTHGQEDEAKRKRAEREREAKRLRAERVQMLYEKLLKKVMGMI